MTHAWEFFEDSAGRWRWRTSDSAGSHRESVETFKSGVDCVAHAMRHGYLAGTTFSPLPTPPQLYKPDQNSAV